MVILNTYVYPAILIAIILARISDKAYRRVQQRRRVAVSSQWPRLAPYVSNGCVHAMGAAKLVPGDVIVIQPGLAMCDAVLLRGACLAEQSTLTGEVPSLSSSHLQCRSEHKNFILLPMLYTEMSLSISLARLFVVLCCAGYMPL